jgi:Fe-S cluster biosynthesis and repair protein YggX
MDNNLDARIAQWEKMTAEAPDGMSWFSLGNAYRDANRLEDSAKALQKAIEFDAGLSRAYQLLGQVLIQLSRASEAGRVLTQGYRVAAQRGDVMPQRAMESLLQKLNLPVPEVAKPQPAAMSAAQAGGNTVIDRRTGKPGTKMPDPPMRGKLGKFIFDHYSQETWREWIGMGTKVINEFRLDFSNDEHQKVYEHHMLEWLGISMEEVEEYAKQNAK